MVWSKMQTEYAKDEAMQEKVTALARQLLAGDRTGFETSDHLERHPDLPGWWFFPCAGVCLVLEDTGPLTVFEIKAAVEVRVTADTVTPRIRAWYGPGLCSHCGNILPALGQDCPCVSW